MIQQPTSVMEIVEHGMAWHGMALHRAVPCVVGRPGMTRHAVDRDDHGSGTSRVAALLGMVHC